MESIGAKCLSDAVDSLPFRYQSLACSGFASISCTSSTSGSYLECRTCRLRRILSASLNHDEKACPVAERLSNLKSF